MLISCIMHDTVGCMVICFNIRTHRQAVFIFARTFSGFLASIKFSNGHARTLGTQNHLINYPHVMHAFE